MANQHTKIKKTLTITVEEDAQGSCTLVIDASNTEDGTSLRSTLKFDDNGNVPDRVAKLSELLGDVFL